MSDESGLTKLLGTWPGDETDEQVQEALEGLDPVKELRSHLSRARELLGEARRWANLEHHPIRGFDCTPCHEARAQLLSAIDALL